MSFGGLCPPLFMYIEIEYLYAEDKDATPTKSWTYFHANTDDFAKATKQAGTYFKTFLKENGWGRKAKLISIKKMRTIHEIDSIESPLSDFVAPKRTSTSNKRPSTRKRKTSSSRTKKSK
jgi:hypothetical protein